MAELDTSLPIVQSNQSILIIIQYPEQFLRLLFSNVNRDLLANIPQLIFIQDLRFLADEPTEGFKPFFRVVIMFLDPLPDYLEGEVELLVACLGLVEAGLGEPV